MRFGKVEEKGVDVGVGGGGSGGDSKMPDEGRGYGSGERGDRASTINRSRDLFLDELSERSSVS